MSEIITPSTDIVVPKRELIQPGWHPDIPNEVYHKSNGVSSSTLKTLMEQTPAHLKYYRNHPKPPTKNMKLGTAVHSLVLEPHKFKEDIAVEPSGKKKPTAAQLNAKNGPTEKTLELIAFWEKFALESEGKTVITEAQYEKAKAMAKRVREHPVIGLLVNDLIVESSIYQWYKSMDPDDGTQYQEMLKVRPDGIPRPYPGVLLDLKSCADGSFTGFEQAMRRFYYHLSASMYMELCNQCWELLDFMKIHAFTKFVFVCVENEAPYEVSAYEFSPKFREAGARVFRTAMYRYHKGKEAEWPGYPEEIRMIEPTKAVDYGFIV